MKANIDPTPTSREAINKLIRELASHDPNERIRAQIRLTEIGKPALDILVQMTTKPEIDLRREAAAVLGEMRDPSAIPALINLLVDEAFEVRWRAAESLIKMGRETLVPLFQELLKKERFGSIWFLDSVHHILRKLDKEGYLAPPSQKVLVAFKNSMKEIAIPKAAEKALEALTPPS